MNRPHFAGLTRNAFPSSRDTRHCLGDVMFDVPQEDDIKCDSSTIQVPSADQLRRMMRNQPTMSQEQMDNIRRKLADGDYLTRQAAEECADRLQDDGDQNSSH